MVVPAQLFQLEQLDAEIEHLETRLGQVARMQRRNPELEAAEAQLQRLTAREGELGGSQRTLESELADLETRIKRDQSRMYSGQIVDARELASLEREIQHYSESRGRVEDRLLEMMEQREHLQADIHSAQEQAGGLKQGWEDRQPALTAEAEEITAALGRLRERRGALTGSLDPASLSLYQRLRSASGHAVSAVSNGVCQWCRVAIPPKDVQHARGGSLVTCSNCARILYVGS